MMTQEENKECLLALSAMLDGAEQFYPLAVRANVHQFVEFTGLIREYITICAAAYQMNINFTQEAVLPMEEHHVAYIAEKLNCIFGDSFRANPKLKKVFLKGLFGDQK
jgi:hypothetical protein